MRTSRISRETARLVSSLSSSRQLRTRHSLRALPNASKSDLSAPREVDASEDGSVGSETEQRAADSTLGKRKRDSASALSASTDGSSSKRKPRRQPAKRIKGPNGSLTVEPPLNWERVYNTTAAMRKRVVAPVDTMGCESLAETHRSPRDQRLQTLVSLMLSSQTKDTVTAVAMKNLQDNLPGGFCLESLLLVEPVELNKLIEKVGFHNNKTKFIKAVAVILRDQYGGDIPDTIEGLVALPGVGPKMAYLCMSAAWGRDEGIGVDVHVHRITNLWGWHKTSTPEQTRAELEAWLPKDKWHDINHLLVGFGQTICLPVGRKCGECDLAAEGLCPSAQVAKSPVKKKVKKDVQVKTDEGEVMKEEFVVQADDVGVKVEAKLENEGNVEINTVIGTALPREQDENGERKTNAESLSGVG